MLFYTFLKKITNNAYLCINDLLSNFSNFSNSPCNNLKNV